MRRLFEGGTYSSNYCNWQLKGLLHLGQIVITFRTLLHLGQNVITFRTLLHLGPFITFRPSTHVNMDRCIHLITKNVPNSCLFRYIGEVHIQCMRTFTSYSVVTHTGPLLSFFFLNCSLSYLNCFT